jgi:hypothetical protein
MFSNFVVLPIGEFNALLWPAVRVPRTANQPLSGAKEIGNCLK